LGGRAEVIERGCSGIELVLSANRELAEREAPGKDLFREPITVQV
jgi:hypothetical protein